MLFRAFYALPDSITGNDGQPVNALLGTANLVLREVEEHSPRAVVLCFGPDAADYRVELFDGYHAERPEVPDTLAPQFADSRDFFEAFGWIVAASENLEADDLLGLIRRGRDRGRRAHPRDDRGPGHVPVRQRPGHDPLRAHRRARRRAGGPGRGRGSATGCPRSWCRTSSHCAATPRTASRAPRASARRRRPICSGATARWRRRWTPRCGRPGRGCAPRFSTRGTSCCASRRSPRCRTRA